MFESPPDLERWLKDNRSRVLEIEKEEDGVLDTATLRLSDVVLIRHHDTDDYLSDQALLLKGKGVVATEDGNESLPFAFFEIALTDQWSAQAQPDGLALKTKRGSYLIRTKNAT